MISSLSSSSVEISTGVQANIITNREAQTTATVRDGHTIVIGGLITTRDDSREKKVPILGDVPLLGALFRTTTVVKQRTELLIKRLKLLRKANDKTAKDRASSYLINDLVPLSERKGAATTRPGRWPVHKPTTKPTTKPVPAGKAATGPEK